MAEAGATRYLRKDGWLKLYRSEEAFAATARERDYAGQLGLNHRVLDTDEARALEPSLMPVFRRAVHWPDAASVSNPLAVTKAYAAAFGKHGGVIVKGDARTLHRAGADWRVDTDEGPIDAKEALVALGPWAPDLLGPLGIKLPLAFKRGYHRHYHALGNAGLTRPIVDTEYGYCLAPMEQGIRLTTGAEFAERDAPPTPEQFARADAGGAQAVSAGRGDRGAALDGFAAVLCRFTPGDRTRAGTAGPVARLRPRPLGADARPGQRPPHRRDDDRRDAVLRPQALCRGAVRTLTCVAPAADPAHFPNLSRQDGSAPGNGSARAS